MQISEFAIMKKSFEVESLSLLYSKVAEVPGVARYYSTISFMTNCETVTLLKFKFLFFPIFCEIRLKMRVEVHREKSDHDRDFRYAVLRGRK